MCVRVCVTVCVTVCARVENTSWPPRYVWGSTAGRSMASPRVLVELQGVCMCVRARACMCRASAQLRHTATSSLIGQPSPLSPIHTHPLPSHQVQEERGQHAHVAPRELCVQLQGQSLLLTPCVCWLGPHPAYQLAYGTADSRWGGRHEGREGRAEHLQENAYRYCGLFLMFLQW